jgi:HK97 family phage portal protein
MNILGFELRRRITEQSISVAVTDVSPVRKAISYSDIFSHGLPMEMFFKNVTRPYENIATVYKSVKALCDNVPQARLMIYNKNTDEETQDARLQLLLDNPNKVQSQSDFIQEWVGFYALYGEGFIKKVQSLGQAAGNMGLPAELLNLDPSKVKEIVDFSIGQLSGWRFGTRIFASEELIHTKDFNPYNMWRGMSPLKPIDDEIEIDQSSLTFNNAFFKNNATAGLILSTDGNLSDEQRKQIKAALDTKYAGAGGANAFKSLILEKGLKPADAGQHTHREMEFIEQKKLMREEILGIWRTPKALFNITDDLNYATFMGQMRVFWLYGLMPIMRKFEDSINKNIIAVYNPNLYIAFDYKNTPAFQEDFKERVSTAQILSAIGFTGNEINEKLELGFDETDWREKWWAPFSLTPVDDTNLEEIMNPPEPEPLPADAQGNGDEPKSVKMDIAWETKKAQFLKIFLRGQALIEDKMEKKLGRYFMGLRAEYLKLPDDALINMVLSINWEAQDNTLDKTIRPVMLEGIKIGVTIGESVLGKKKSVDDAFDQTVNSLLQIRMDKLTGINATIKGRVESALRDTLAQQIQIGVSLTQQADELRGAVRDFFNLSAKRARLIARTESGGAVNGGSHLYYESEGVQKKRWVTAHDELVRESHRECEAQGAISIDRSYVNGLMYPQDQSNGDAAEVCNCRCSELPVVD